VAALLQVTGASPGAAEACRELWHGCPGYGRVPPGSTRTSVGRRAGPAPAGEGDDPRVAVFVETSGMMPVVARAFRSCEAAVKRTWGDPDGSAR
jgi:hypothetical protein